MDSIKEGIVDLEFLETLLGIRLPQSYRTFLLNAQGEGAVIDGFRMLGVPGTEDGVSVLHATLLLRDTGPERWHGFVPICIHDTRALCLDLPNADDQDAPLVEIDIDDPAFIEPRTLGLTFGAWLDQHETMARRFSSAWNRVRNRQKETRRGRKATQWDAVINRVADYIVGLAAFRLNERHGCLEVDEFLPVNQAHIQEGEALKGLLSEVFARARDYSGSLNLVFTRDLREDESGQIPEVASKTSPRRIPSIVPASILAFADKHGISINGSATGVIEHEEALDLWLALCGLPPELIGQATESEKAGYLSRDILAEVIATDIWSKEEAIWFFGNASRPEALLVGSDVPEDRLYYSESLDWARAALLARRFRQAVLVELTEGQSIEDLEHREEYCVLEAAKDLWILRANRGFTVPRTWLLDQTVPATQIPANEAILVLSRPMWPTNLERDLSWLERAIERLGGDPPEARNRAILLSYEFRAKPDYSTALALVVRSARAHGVQILFAPSRIEIFLDREIERLMKRARNFRRFPARKGPIALLLFDLESIRSHPDSSLWARVEEAMQGAHVFAERLTKRRDVGHCRQEFSLACDLVERIASEHTKAIADVDGPDGADLAAALRLAEVPHHSVTFPFVAPDGAHLLADKLKDDRLRRAVAQSAGGLVVVVKPWSSARAPAERVEQQNTSVHLSQQALLHLERRRTSRQYVRRQDQIRLAHDAVLSALLRGIPLSVAAIRSDALVEVLRDYAYSLPDTEPVSLSIAYGDGTGGTRFPLFGLTDVQPPTDGLYDLPVGLTSMRHLSVDQFTERALIRNLEIQYKDATEQDELAFTRTWECLDEFLQLLQGKLPEAAASTALRAFLWRSQLVQSGKWRGLRVQLFHSTELETAAIGAYRAVISLLQKYRGSLIVVPRILKPIARGSEPDQEGGADEPVVDDYQSSEPWY